jgi:hypothetical protein
VPKAVRAGARPSIHKEQAPCSPKACDAVRDHGCGRVLDPHMY